MRAPDALVVSAVVTLTLASAGCWPADTMDEDELTFALSPEPFTVTTADRRWRPPPPEGVPEVVCRGGAALVSDCCQPPAPAAAIDCRQYPVACDEQDGFCALIFDYEQTLELNLARDVPELQPLRDRVIAEVELDHLEARVAGDELPVRHMDLFVAPAGTTSAGRAGALHLARLGAGPATTSIPLEPEARLAFAAFAVDHRSPFALVLLTHVVQRSGAAWQGTFSVQLTATLTARF